MSDRNFRHDAINSCSSSDKWRIHQDIQDQTSFSNEGKSCNADDKNRSNTEQNTEQATSDGDTGNQPYIVVQRSETYTLRSSFESRKDWERFEYQCATLKSLADFIIDSFPNFDENLTNEIFAGAVREFLFLYNGVVLVWGERRILPDIMIFSTMFRNVETELEV